MTYGPGHSSGTAGALVPGTLARYLPFGDWRAQPSADLTDIGFTSHKSNNVGSNDIGLIYMNARFYVSYINRFLSADSIVPDPANPQSLNRYSYSYNNPVKYFDPSGHCAETGDDACWGWYDRTTHLCPECRELGWEQYGYNFQEEMYYLVKGGWRPETPSNAVPSASPIQFTRIDEPKPDFPIVAWWNQNQGDNFSKATDVAGIVVSSGKVVLSGIGVASNLGFPILGDLSIDKAEDVADWLSLFFDVAGEIANGNTRTAFEANGRFPNTEVTVILGQDVSQDIGLIIADRMIPGSEFDLIVNVYETYYGVQKLRGRMPNRLETRIGTVSPYFEIR